MKHFLNTLALTFISFSGRFVFAMQKHYLFFASDPLVTITFSASVYMIFWFICLHVSTVASVVLLFGLVEFRVKDWSSKPCPGPGDCTP